MDNERPIEKLLRAWAKKRRDDAGAPPELHPATRRLLQGEVSRQFPKTAPADAPFWRRLMRLRPRLVYALGVFTVVVAGTSLLLPSLNRTRPGSQPMPAAGASGKDLAWNRPVNPTPINPLRPGTGFPDGLTMSVARGSSPAAPAASDRDQFATGEQLAASPLSGRARSSELAGKSNALTATAAAPVSGMDNKSKLEAAAAVAIAGDEVRPADDSGFAVTSGPSRSGVRGTLSGGGVAAEGLAPTANAEVPTSLVAAVVSGSRQEPDRQREAELKSKADAVTLALNTAPRAPAATPWPPPRPEQLAERVAVYGAVVRGGTPVVQRFARSDAAHLQMDQATTAKETGPTQVLASFQIEQTGNQLRVIDRDGSVYTGSVETAAAPTASSVPEPAEPMAQAPTGGGGGGGGGFGRGGRESNVFGAVALRAKTPSALQPYDFRVSGMNRTLQQPIVFAWSFVPLTNGNSARRQTVTTTTTVTRSGDMSRQNLGAQPLGLSGQVRIGEASETRVEAVPTGP